MMIIKILFLTSVENDIHTLIQASKEIAKKNNPKIKIVVQSKRDLENEAKFKCFLNEIKDTTLMIVNLMAGKESLPGFEIIAEMAIQHRISCHYQYSAPGKGGDLKTLSTVADADYRQIQHYIYYGGKRNMMNLMLWAVNRFSGVSQAFNEPEKLPFEGIYHPEFLNGIELEAYRSQKCTPDRATIGILFYRSHWLAENILFIDCLIKTLEKLDVNVMPVFVHASRDRELGSNGLAWAVEHYFMRQEEAIVDAVISLLSFSPFNISMTQSEEGEPENCLEKLNVTVLKAIATTNNLKRWSESTQGLNSLDMVMNVAMPEFDGNLITVPIATKEYGKPDVLTGASTVYYQALPERVEKVSKMALNWAKLRRKSNAEKKVAIIFHNHPPRNDRIGCAFGLDSPASVWNILKALKEAGYTLEALPQDGPEIIATLMRRVTNDRRWYSEEKMASLAIDGVTPEEYEDWFNDFPEIIREKMTVDWGQAPGEVFNYGDKLLIPGIINGNIFIGVQPPRGFGEDLEKTYHSPDATPPHHYLAYYRWLRDDFKADAVLHIGKHGSLEWLPGKSVGLSESCYPDLAISDLPNIYPYIINDPGEGTQAKRRSYACIIDHLVPVMTNADTYDELAEIEVQLEAYYHAKMVDQDKLPFLEKLIWEKVQKADLDKDLELNYFDVMMDFSGFLEMLHGYISEIKDTQIKDGLHILGEAPQAERQLEMLIALTRLANGSVPSLRQATAEALGYDYDKLLSERGKLISTLGKTNGDILTEVDGVVYELVKGLNQVAFNPEKIPEIIAGCLHNRVESVVITLHYIAKTLVQKLNLTSEELLHVVNALNGGYTPPGPSGAPTRGMADILPTGRNFYSVDPKSLPSPAAWKVGAKMGDALIERYREDKGAFPESVGIIIWGSPTMRTKGDDIAQVLYLLGIKPVWEERSGRVKGLKVITAKELGRPRIDVTLRISGMFRDAFPNLIDLIDEAIFMAAAMDEGDDENYLAKHMRLEIAEGIQSGLNRKQATRNAGYRIFGCPPGAYGAGVSHLIDEKNWENGKDLGAVYVTWGGYAYGRNTYGKTVPEVFKKRLSKLDLTVKNEDTREHDMIDSDDFYSYHGGMIAAVKAFKGVLPQSYCGDSSDPERVRMRTTKEETKHIFRSRVLNPKWIASMQKHGYKGAGDLSAMVDHLFGWDATGEVMEDWMYERLANTYVLNKELQEWFKKVNPYALQNITERLLEAEKRVMWRAEPELTQALKDIYLDIEGDLEGLNDHL